jgi:hypothetical protein
MTEFVEDDERRTNHEAGQKEDQALPGGVHFLPNAKVSDGGGHETPEFADTCRPPTFAPS